MATGGRRPFATHARRKTAYSGVAAPRLYAGDTRNADLRVHPPQYCYGGRVGANPPYAAACVAIG